MKKIFLILIFFASFFSIQLFANNNALNSDKINFIFVTSPDLKFHDTDDIQKINTNLTVQGLNRSFKIASFIKDEILAQQNITKIFTIQPLSHIQNGYPDMTSLEFIEQFAMLNESTHDLTKRLGGKVSANSTSLNASYEPSNMPNIIEIKASQYFCNDCNGVNFQNSNINYIQKIIESKQTGFYLFSMPWEVVSKMISNTNKYFNYKLSIPTKFKSSNLIYTISIDPNNTNVANFTTYDSRIKPDSTYPQIDNQISTNNPCKAKVFDINATKSIYPNINKNQTVYFVRHAEAHPNGTKYDNGNFVAAGQWRALAMPLILKDKIKPSVVVSLDPSQIINEQGSNGLYSYVGPSLTVQPYAIYNNLPFKLANSVYWSDPSLAIRYLFYNKEFDNQTILVGWEHLNTAELMRRMLSENFQTNLTAEEINAIVQWEYNDYDSIWVIKTDKNGNLNFNNQICQGIDSALLPVIAPKF